MTNNKALFLKWIKNLFYIECVAFLLYLISQLPFVGSWLGWIAFIVSGIRVYCLYNLLPINERYKKAFTFSAITLALTLVLKVSDMWLLSIVAMVTGLIELYQEFCGHSEVLLTIDSKLSGKWHSLFNWNVFGSIIVAILGAPVIIVAAVAFVLDANIISILTTIMILGFDIILKVIYLVYLKRTHDVCEKYEHWVDDVATGNEI